VTRHTYTAVVRKEGDGFVTLCAELDVASQGATVEEATAKLREAVELFLECAAREELARRVHSDVFVTRFDVTRRATRGGSAPSR
jgi:predicted RNase H-like HicB family nuclease